MTEAEGSAARWSAVALLGPVAAGVFAGSVVWATDHNPVATPTPPQVPAPTALVADSRVSALQAQVARDRSLVASLTQTVVSLQNQAAAVASSATRATPVQQIATRPPAVQATRLAPVPQPAPVRAAPPSQAAAPAPVVQAVTGASGARK